MSRSSLWAAALNGAALMGILLLLLPDMPQWERILLFLLIIVFQTTERFQ